MIEIIRGFVVRKPLSSTELELARKAGLIYCDGGCWAITPAGRKFLRDTNHIEVTP
jgi:hypothetical protein